MRDEDADRILCQRPNLAPGLNLSPRPNTETLETENAKLRADNFRLSVAAECAGANAALRNDEARRELVNARLA